MERAAAMGYQAKKTEHSGAKHGGGAYWGPKKDAKKESGKIRRRNEKQALREQLAEGARRRAERNRLLKTVEFPKKFRSLSILQKTGKCDHGLLKVLQGTTD
jgi:hypothetical protein